MLLLEGSEEKAVGHVVVVVALEGSRDHLSLCRNLELCLSRALESLDGGRVLETPTPWPAHCGRDRGHLFWHLGNERAHRLVEAAEVAALDGPADQEGEE